MKSIPFSGIVVLAAIFFTAFASNARAGMLDRKTRVTFSKPVEIPGLVLPAGSYVFERVDSTQHVVRVLNAKETRVYATLLTVPEYLLHPAEPVITFEERGQGAPEAIDAWFYPGDTVGDEFVYTKPATHELRGTINQK